MQKNAVLFSASGDVRQSDVAICKRGFVFRKKHNSPTYMAVVACLPVKVCSKFDFQIGHSNFFLLGILLLKQEYKGWPHAYTLSKS